MDLQYMACDNAMLHGHASFLNVKHVLNGESVDLVYRGHRDREVSGERVAAA